MKTTQLVVAAAVLLGGAYVAAQVDSPGNADAMNTPEEVSASTSTSAQDGAVGDSFENAASTSTRDASGERPAGEEDIGAPDRERMENRRGERGGAPTDRDAGGPEVDSGDSQTRPQRP